MRLIVQACILGLLTGGVYALMASGLTLAFGIMRVINVAQGAMIILGAYLSYTAFSALHIDPFLSILLLTPLVFALGVTVQLVFIRSLRSDERGDCRCWSPGRSPRDRRRPERLLSHQLPLHDHDLREQLLEPRRLPRVRGPGVRVRDLDGHAHVLYLLLSRTQFGRAIRATVQNPVSAPSSASTAGSSRRSGSGSASQRPRRRAPCTG